MTLQFLQTRYRGIVDSDSLPVEPDLSSTILLWARPFLEGCLWINRRFRHVGDQDEALLYLAAWHFLMGDIAANADVLGDIGRLPAEKGLLRLDLEDFRASPIAALAEETGIPRETVRRKASGLVRRGVFLVRRDGTFQLAAVTTDILDLLQPAQAFGQWVLLIHGVPPSALGQPRSVRSFGALVRHYLAAYLAQLRSRRIHTGAMSHVPVQVCLMLLHALKVERRMALQGPPDRWDFPTFIEISRHLFDEPYYLRQVSDMAGLSLAFVRASCRRLADLHGLVTLGEGDVLQIGGSKLNAANVGDRRFYSRDVEQRLTVFARRVFDRVARQRLQRTGAPGSDPGPG